MIKIRQSWDNLIFIIGIPLLVYEWVYTFSWHHIPYKLCNHNLYIEKNIYPHIDNTQSSGYNFMKKWIKKQQEVGTQF